jgi:hypothetical protein
MKRKITALLLAAAMCAAMTAGCGGGGASVVRLPTASSIDRQGGYTTGDSDEEMETDIAPDANQIDTSKAASEHSNITSFTATLLGFKYIFNEIQIENGSDGYPVLSFDYYFDDDGYFDDGVTKRIIRAYGVDLNGEGYPSVKFSESAEWKSPVHYEFYFGDYHNRGTQIQYDFVGFGPDYYWGLAATGVADKTSYMGTFVYSKPPAEWDIKIDVPYALPSAPPADYITIKGERYSTSLTELRLSGLLGADIEPLRYMTNLTELWLTSTDISDISPLAELKNLKLLGLNINNISDISPLTGLTNLTLLDLGLNQISDISPLAGLTKLTKLGLGANNISDISPLAGLINLTFLDLGNNQISDISPLAGLTELTELGLGGNNISDISPLVNMSHLTRLWFEENSVTDWSPVVHVPDVLGRP